MSDRLTPEREAEIAARADAATKGPWGLYDDETGLIDVAADLEDTGHGYRCRRYIGQLEADQIDNDPTHRDWTEEQDKAQVAADAAFIAHAREDVDLLRAELAAVRAERDQAQARVAELERPAIEAQRNEIRSSYSELIAQCEQDRDFEGAFDVQCRLREREEQWKLEDAAGGGE